MGSGGSVWAVRPVGEDAVVARGREGGQVEGDLVFVVFVVREEGYESWLGGRGVLVGCL